MQRIRDAVAIITREECVSLRVACEIFRDEHGLPDGPLDAATAKEHLRCPKASRGPIS
jgi:hypothetical protein